MPEGILRICLRAQKDAPLAAIALWFQQQCGALPDPDTRRRMVEFMSSL